MLELSSKVKYFLVRVLSRPDEVYGDKVRSDVKYFLRRLNDKFLCIVVVNDEVVTAYLINLKNMLR
jgi:hypothetical protein